MFLSQLPQSISRYKARDALRLGLQTAVSAVALYTLMEAFSLPEKFVGVLSAVLVVEKSIGSSFSSSADRFIATLVGCGIGVSCLYLVPDGYRVLLGLAISMFVMNAVSAFRPGWRYGVVAAVALAINPSEDPMTVAFDRSVAIGLGVLVGSLVAVLIWPDRSSARARRHLRIASDHISDYLDRAVQNSLAPDSEKNTGFEQFSNQYSTHLSQARSLAADVNIADNDRLMETIEATERLKQAATMIRSISDDSLNLDDASSSIRESVDRVRKILCDAADRLAEDKRENDLQIEKLDSALQHLRGQVKQVDSDSDHALALSAFLFALKETQESFARLDRLNEATQ